ncbi:transposable element Tcb2 transposase [Trichonephila clavipes]|nr:transposable element Tcb2 transposase [Trichonephila clavipes]
MQKSCSRIFPVEKWLFAAKDFILSPTRRVDIPDVFGRSQQRSLNPTVVTSSACSNIAAKKKSPWTGRMFLSSLSQPLPQHEGSRSEEDRRRFESSLDVTNAFRSTNNVYIITGYSIDKLLGAVNTRRYPHAENRVWSDQEDHEERGYRRIVRQALVEPTVTRSTIRADVGVAIVPQTISRHLAEGNLKSKRPFRALPLTPEHGQLHLQWYQARSMWNVTDWQKVVFSDESRFVLGTDDMCVRVWRRPGERYNSLPPPHCSRSHFRTAGVMVWGGIAYDNLSTLIVMRRTLTGQRYIDDILRPHSLPSPARTQDLSPVEHVWDQLKRQMPSCHSVHDLELTVKDWWALLPQNNIRCLINSMPDRGVACIAAGDRRQEEEPMDWEDVPFLPEVSAPFVPSRPPRKMRSLISVQVSEPPSLSANRFPNMRALVPKKLLGAVNTRRYPHAENRVWSDQEDHEERGYRRIVRQALVEPTVTRSTIRADVGVAIVPQTISRHLAEGNLKSKRPFRALPLTPEHGQLHLQWYQARSMWNVTDWQKVVFSDESRFVLGTDDMCVRVWRRPAYDNLSTLIVMRRTLTGQRYIDDILRPHSLPSPARTQDLSPVEHVWDQLKRQMPSCHSVHDLELTVKDWWALLPQNNIRCLINSMPDRGVACIAAGDRRQEEEPMDWEDVPFLPEVSAPFVPSRPPRKMRSLISVQVSEPPSLSANRFPNMRALVPKEDHEERGYRRIVRQALVEPTMTRSTIRADVGVAIVPQTISRHLAEGNLKSKRPFRALPLTPEHGQLHLQWYQARSMWNVTDWQKVVFSDESRFVLGTDDMCVRVWRRPDNARPHEARVAQNFLRHFQSLPWPARIQDLSPVEHVWDQLKPQMPSCHSVHDLELTVKDWCALLPQNNIRCLINSMPDRGVACIAAGDRRQEEEPMDWEDVPFLPEVSAPFVPSRPPRKMRSLISVQVSEPPSLSANRFPNMRALVPKKLLGAVNTRRYPHAENRVWSDQEDHEERGYRRIVRQALVEPTVTRSTIRADVGVAIVPQTISRHLAEGNLKSKRPFRALPLTPEHGQLHLQWYQARSMWNVTDWQKVVFSDESRFVLGTDDMCVRVWRRPAYDNLSTLIVMRGTLTGQRYIDDILRPHVGPFLNGLPGAIFSKIMLVHMKGSSTFQSSLDVTNAFRSTNNVYIITGYSIDVRGVFLHSRGCPESLLRRAASRDQSSRPPSGVPRATLCIEQMTAADGY